MGRNGLLTECYGNLSYLSISDMTHYYIASQHIPIKIDPSLAQ